MTTIRDAIRIYCMTHGSVTATGVSEEYGIERCKVSQEICKLCTRGELNSESPTKHRERVFFATPKTKCKAIPKYRRCPSCNGRLIAGWDTLRNPDYEPIRETIVYCSKCGTISETYFSKYEGGHTI